MFVFCSDISCREMQCNRDVRMFVFCTFNFVREFLVFVFYFDISCREMQ